MSVPIRVTMAEERPPEVSVRAWRALMRASHVVMGEHWHRRHLPKHFQRGARERYQYQPRSRGYLARKANTWRRGKAAPPFVDLVFTGQLRRLLLSLATIRGFPTRATLQMVAPRYVTFRPRGNQPDKHAELVRVTRDEDRELSELLNAEVTRRLNAHREPRTTTAG